MAAIYRLALSLSRASITRRKLRMKWRLRVGAAEGRGHCRTYGRSQFMLDPRDRSPELRQSACPTSPMFNLLIPFIRKVVHMIKHSSFRWELGSVGDGACICLQTAFIIDVSIGFASSLKAAARLGRSA